MRGLSRRAWLAIAAVVIGVGGPLVFGWVTGRSAALAEADELRAAPRRAVAAAAERIARAVSERLAGLVDRESARPFFHYQNFFVDPRGAYAGTAVVPSPLADAPGDPLIAAHFQVDAAGKLTMPSVAEGVPEAPPAKPADAALLGALRAASVPPPGLPDGLDGPAVAALAVAAPEVARESANEPAGGLANEAKVPRKGEGTARKAAVQEVVLGAEQYQQNVAANEIYNVIQQRQAALGNGPGEVPQQAVVEQQLDIGQQVDVVQQRVDVGQHVELGQPSGGPTEPRAPTPSARPASVVVRVGPFAWSSLVLGGEPRLVALRAVEAPDGARTQGFVLDEAALATLLRDGERVGRLLPPGRQAEGAVVAPLALPGAGWQIAVAAGPEEAIAQAEADAVVTGFHLRFAGLGALGLVAAAAIIAALVQAERHLERRQRFAAAAAHELRTPLAGLRMYAEMIAHGLGKPEKQRAYADRLATEAGRLGRVVANVLDFTRMERGNLSVRPQPGDLAAAVEATVKGLEPAIRAAGAALVLVRPEGPMPAAFDPDALGQILANLVDNAEKYSRMAADRTIEVRVASGEDGPELRVRDHGPGLPPAFERRLFRPFARGAERDGPAGLGLGLALTRALARAQAGDIRFARPAHGGAEFVVRLPATL